MEMIKSIGLILLVMQVNYLFAQTPLDEEFTYQGSLQTSNNPANGQFDFKFVLLFGHKFFLKVTTYFIFSFLGNYRDNMYFCTPFSESSG